MKLKVLSVTLLFSAGAIADCWHGRSGDHREEICKVSHSRQLSRKYALKKAARYMESLVGSEAAITRTMTQHKGSNDWQTCVVVTHWDAVDTYVEKTDKLVEPKMEMIQDQDYLDKEVPVVVRQEPEPQYQNQDQHEQEQQQDQAQDQY